MSNRTGKPLWVDWKRRENSRAARSTPSAAMGLWKWQPGTVASSGLQEAEIGNTHEARRLAGPRRIRPGFDRVGDCRSRCGTAAGFTNLQKSIIEPHVWRQRASSGQGITVRHSWSLRARNRFHAFSRKRRARTRRQRKLLRCVRLRGGCECGETSTEWSE
jgi:hypothetical protein